MVSVVIAAYHGEQYICEQLASVLAQLAPEDEVVISDDCPDGRTYAAILRYAEADKRIHYIAGPGKGVIKNFEHAIRYAKGDYIFLCDQDDVWLDGKVRKVTQALADGAMVVLHDAVVTDDALRPTADSFFRERGSGTGIVKNILKNSYIGCCMAFRRELLASILPFPAHLPMHDQWIGLMGERAGEVRLIDEPLILYRRHAGAVTGGKTTAAQKMKWRISIISALLKRQVITDE